MRIGVRFNNPLPYIAIAITAVGLTILHQQTIGRFSGASYTIPQIAEAKLATGTEGLVKQTAEHLSKMQGGASIGGFPGLAARR